MSSSVFKRTPAKSATPAPVPVPTEMLRRMVGGRGEGTGDKPDDATLVAHSVLLDHDTHGGGQHDAHAATPAHADLHGSSVKTEPTVLKVAVAAEAVATPEQSEQFLRIKEAIAPVPMLDQVSPAELKAAVEEAEALHEPVKAEGEQPGQQHAPAEELASPAELDVPAAEKLVQAVELHETASSVSADEALVLAKWDDTNPDALESELAEAVADETGDIHDAGTTEHEMNEQPLADAGGEIGERVAAANADDAAQPSETGTAETALHLENDAAGAVVAEAAIPAGHGGSAPLPDTIKAGGSTADGHHDTGPLTDVSVPGPVKMAMGKAAAAKTIEPGKQPMSTDAAMVPKGTLSGSQTAAAVPGANNAARTAPAAAVPKETMARPVMAAAKAAQPAQVVNQVPAAKLISAVALQQALETGTYKAGRLAQAKSAIDTAEKDIAAYQTLAKTLEDATAKGMQAEKPSDFKKMVEETEAAKVKAEAAHLAAVKAVAPAGYEVQAGRPVFANPWHVEDSAKAVLKGLVDSGASPAKIEEARQKLDAVKMPESNAGKAEWLGEKVKNFQTEVLGKASLVKVVDARINALLSDKGRLEQEIQKVINQQHPLIEKHKHTAANFLREANQEWGVFRKHISEQNGYLKERVDEIKMLTFYRGELEKDIQQGQLSMVRAEVFQKAAQLAGDGQPDPALLKTELSKAEQAKAEGMKLVEMTSKLVSATAEDRDGKVKADAIAAKQLDAAFEKRLQADAALKSKVDAIQARIDAQIHIANTAQTEIDNKQKQVETWETLKQSRLALMPAAWDAIAECKSWSQPASVRESRDASTADQVAANVIGKPIYKHDTDTYWKYVRAIDEGYTLGQQFNQAYKTQLDHQKELIKLTQVRDEAWGKLKADRSELQALKLGDIASGNLSEHTYAKARQIVATALPELSKAMAVLKPFTKAVDASNAELAHQQKFNAIQMKASNDYGKKQLEAEADALRIKVLADEGARNVALKPVLALAEQVKGGLIKQVEGEIGRHQASLSGFEKAKEGADRAVKEQWSVIAGKVAAPGTSPAKINEIADMLAASFSGEQQVRQLMESGYKHAAGPGGTADGYKAEAAKLPKADLQKLLDLQSVSRAWGGHIQACSSQVADATKQLAEIRVLDSPDAVMSKANAMAAKVVNFDAIVDPMQQQIAAQAQVVEGLAVKLKSYEAHDAARQIHETGAAAVKERLINVASQQIAEARMDVHVLNSKLSSVKPGTSPAEVAASKQSLQAAEKLLSAREAALQDLQKAKGASEITLVVQALASKPDSALDGHLAKLKVAVAETPRLNNNLNLALASFAPHVFGMTQPTGAGQLALHPAGQEYDKVITGPVKEAREALLQKVNAELAANQQAQTDLSATHAKTTKAVVTEWKGVMAGTGRDMATVQSLTAAVVKYDMTAAELRTLLDRDTLPIGGVRHCPDDVRAILKECANTGLRGALEHMHKLLVAREASGQALAMGDQAVKATESRIAAYAKLTGTEETLQAVERETSSKPEWLAQHARAELPAIIETGKAVQATGAVLERGETTDQVRAQYERENFKLTTAKDLDSARQSKCSTHLAVSSAFSSEADAIMRQKLAIESTQQFSNTVEAIKARVEHALSTLAEAPTPETKSKMDAVVKDLRGGSGEKFHPGESGGSKVEIKWSESEGVKRINEFKDKKPEPRTDEEKRQAGDKVREKAWSDLKDSLKKTRTYLNMGDEFLKEQAEKSAKQSNSMQKAGFDYVLAGGAWHNDDMTLSTIGQVTTTANAKAFAGALGAFATASVNLTVEGGAKAKGEVALADRLLLVGAASVYGSGTVEGKANASATVLGVAADVGVKAVVYGEAAAKAGLKIHDHFGVDVGVQAEGSGEASAKAGVKMGADGIAVKLNASAEASVRANFASNLKLGPVDIQHQFRAYALAKADASLSGSVGLLDGKLELSAKAGAWAGAAVGLEVGRTIKVAGITLDSSAGIYAGKLGGAAGVDASYKGGKLTLGVSFGLAIGVGLNVNFSITIDFVELIEKVENELSKLAANDTDRQNMKNLGAWSRQVGGMPMFMQ